MSFNTGNPVGSTDAATKNSVSSGGQRVCRLDLYGSRNSGDMENFWCGIGLMRR